MIIANGFTEDRSFQRILQKSIGRIAYNGGVYSLINLTTAIDGFMERGKLINMTHAVVIFSGGQDSTTCLHWAKNRYSQVSAITFNYGQRHAIELQQAKLICDALSVNQVVIDLSFLGQIVNSALLSSNDFNQKSANHLPATFVPNRNQLFITLAHAYAQKIASQVLITGVCQVDFSGYPDCRAPFISAITQASNLGSDADIDIKTPLMNLDKGEIFSLAEAEGCLDSVVEVSHTCYEGNRSQRHEWGYGCNRCEACRLRAKGWSDYQNRKQNEFIR